MDYWIEELRDAIETSVPTENLKRKSGIEKFLLKLAVRIPGVRGRTKHKLQRSLAKAMAVDLALTLSELQGANSSNNEQSDLSTPAVSRTKSRLFIDAQHGLGNRMRAIGSAAAVAKATGRELVVVWEPDHHCECELHDLYKYGGSVINETFVGEARERGCQVYNYMDAEEGAVKDAPLDLTWGGDIFVRSAYLVNAKPAKGAATNKFLQSLTPVEAVRDLVAGVRTPNDLSAHVRMVGGTQYEHLAYEKKENWSEKGHAQTDFWRRKSHFSHFITRIDTLIAEGRAEKIFLAADLPETYDALLSAFGDRIAYLEREQFDRSKEQLVYALADAMLLGSSPLMLGSSWSSFSELAVRLSPTPIKIEMSGEDF